MQNEYGAPKYFEQNVNFSVFYSIHYVAVIVNISSLLSALSVNIKMARQNVYRMSAFTALFDT